MQHKPCRKVGSLHVSQYLAAECTLASSHDSKALHCLSDVWAAAMQQGLAQPAGGVRSKRSGLVPVKWQKVVTRISLTDAKSCSMAEQRHGILGYWSKPAACHAAGLELGTDIVLQAGHSVIGRQNRASHCSPRMTAPLHTHSLEDLQRSPESSSSVCSKTEQYQQHVADCFSSTDAAA